MYLSCNMFSSLVITIIYLAAVKNSESALIETDINSYIKNKLKDTKELLDKSYTALSIDHNKNITTAPRESFDGIVEKEHWEEFWNKNLDPSTLNLNDKVIFVKCVRKLENLLNHRMKMNVRLKKMNLERGNVGLASFEQTQSNNDAGSPIIVNPNELKNLLIASLADIAAKELAVPEKQIIFKNENGYMLRGAVTLNGLVNFQEMLINNLSATYLMDKKAEDLLISETDQSFSTNLRNLKNRIKNLELNSICDLPFKYWLQNHDRSLNNIDLNSCTIYNESIISVDSVNGAYRLSEINVNKINGIDIKNLVNTSFLLGENQVIQGDLVSVNPVRAVELFAERINKVSSTKLLNKVKNDSVDEIGIDRLEVHHLLVDKINEVDVSDAARLSTKNLIKGKVRISNLLIRNELRVKDTIAAPLNNSIQVYEEVLIDGNVLVKNAQIESEDCVTIALDRDKTKRISSSQVLQHSWKKSEGQTIFRDVRFEKGASINQLECQRLNGLEEDDFVYSSADSLRLENVTFKNVHSTGQFLTEGNNGSDGSFFKRPSPEFIVFDKLMRFEHLSVDSLVVDNYNGVDINDIIHANNDSFVSDSPADFEIFRATGLMLTQELNVNWLNGRSASTSFKEALRRDNNLKVHNLVGKKGTREVSVIKMHNVKIKDLNGKSLEDGLLKQESLIKNSGEKIALTVAERLEVESNLNVINGRLNGEVIVDFISRMKGLHLDDVIELRRIKGMEVLGNLSARRFLMEKLEDIFAEALSLSSQQIVPSSKLIAEHVKINYLSSERLNEIMTSSLMHTDDILRSINGDKYFSSLVVEGNIKTKSLNDEPPPTAEKLAEPLKISGSMLNNESVHVFGSVLWKDESHSSTHQSESSVQNLFRYAVLKTVDQVVHHPLDVERPTTIDSLEVAKKNSSLIVNSILDTLSDALIDCDECGDSSTSSSASTVTGKKVLRKGVKANHAKVSSNIETRSINHVHFDNTSLRLFRKSDNKMTLAELYFLGDLEIESLRTQNRSGEGISVHNFARTDEIMPGRLAFRHLIVERDISLFQLDNVVFNDFVAKRVKTANSYDIFADVLFNQSVTVLNNSSIVLLNGIRDKHLVLKSALAPPAASLIKGRKRFSSILRIENNLDVTSLKSDFNESFVNADDTEIFGNLEIEDDVENLKDIILLGQLKNTGMELRSEPSIEKSRNILMKKAKAVNRLVAARAPTDKLTGRFFYLERVNNFDLHWLSRVQPVTSTIIDPSHTRLDLYTSEEGTFCGLPIECSCRAHTLLEISSSGDQRVIQAKRPNVLFNFHEPTALFGLTVISEMNEVMQSCEHRPSAAKIFWTKLNANGESQTENLAVRVEGFIAHAQVFLINNDKLYMVLAKFYDNILRSHATDSLVYEFNLHSKTVSKCQTIATEGAKEVHIFQVAKAGVYALIGCIKGKAETLLLRFDPTTRQFQLVRTFTTGGSKHIASLSTENKSFVILSNPDIEAIQIYIYNAAYDNFYDYQNLYFQSRVSSLNTFYSEDFGQSKAYVTITTKDGLFYIYEYTFSGKFKIKMSYWIEDFQVLSPFSIGNQKYLFATHRLNSTIFKLVQDNN